MNDNNQDIVRVPVQNFGQLSIMDVKKQVNDIQLLMRDVMQEKEHFGTIPGCGDKPTLLQPGAQKLALTFGFAPEYTITERQLDREHREYNVRCRLTHRNSGNFVGEGVGCGSTMESRHRFRTGPKSLTNTAVPPEYWDLRKNDPPSAQLLIGAGNSVAKNEHGVWMIATGGGAKIENENPADCFNTVLKMAKKRAYVDAVLTATAASDIFTQDLDDLEANAEAAQQPNPAAKTQRASFDPNKATGAPQAQTRQTPPPQQPAKQAYTRQPAPQQQAPDTNGHVGIAKVEIAKSGITNGKPWTRYAITDTAGNEFSTFSQTDADLAYDAKETGQAVEVEWEANKYGKTLNALRVVDGEEAHLTLPTFGRDHRAIEDAEVDAAGIHI